MKNFYLLIVAGVALLLHACSKNEYQSIKPEVHLNTPGGTTGLSLNVGESGVFEVITTDGNAAGVANNSTAVYDTLNAGPYAGTAFQKWLITHVDVQHYTIMNVGSGLYARSYTYKGTEVLIQDKYKSIDAYLWTISGLGNKIYKAVNKADGLSVNSNLTGMIQLKPYTGLASEGWAYNQLPASDTLKSQTFMVSNVLQSNMVVQRDKPFKVWGKASPNFVVSVKASWNSGLYSGTADASGNWLVTIPSAPVNTTPQTLIASVDGQRPDTLKNLLLGDVWICSGQSNMVMPMTQSDQLFGGYNGVINYQTELAAANYPNIRLMRVDSNSTIGNSGVNDINSQSTPQDYDPKIYMWQVCSPVTAARFCATGYYFSKKVYTSLAEAGQIVPIGLVQSSVGGTPCQYWTPTEEIQNNPTLLKQYGTSGNSGLYNGMIYPLHNLSIKGFIWYQGESNESDQPESTYTLLNSKMIEGWRSVFGQGNLPFYFVQLAPMTYDFFSTNPWGADTTSNTGALLRDAQAKVRQIEPNTGMATTADIDEVITIHNQYKAPVGDRLGRLALENDYGLPVNAYGPAYQSFTQNGRTVTITFTHATGLNSGGKAVVQKFTVAGDNNMFEYARATIVGETIVLNIPADITIVKNIRYAFYDWPVTTLQNSDGLPMEPFRTDNFAK